MIRRLLFLAAALASAPVFAANETPPTTYTAERTRIDAKTGEWSGTGNARFSAEGNLLTADQVTYNPKTNIATGSGNVVLTRGPMRLLADRLSYNLKDGSYTAENVRLGSHPYYVEGRRAEGNRTEVTVYEARGAYGEPGRWQPTVTADKVTYSEKHGLSSDNARAGVGDARFLPFPKFRQEFAQPFVGSLSLAGGYRRSLGVIAEAGARIPVTPTLRLGADLGLYTERGVMFGPAGRYSSADGSEKLSGYFRTGYINDHGEKGTDLLNRPVPEERAYAEWQHRQLLTDNLSLNAQLNWWKDSEVLRDFRPRAFFPVQEPDTYVESVYNGQNYFLSLFARFQPNRFHHVQERMPELRFDMLPLALPGGFYERFNASVVSLREDLFAETAPTAPAGFPVENKRRSNRFDAYYSLERPITHKDWLAFTPVAGARVTHYTGTTGEVVRNTDNAVTRTVGEVGFDTVLRSSGTFDYKNPRWKIDGLRHLFTPKLSYRFIDVDRANTRIPAIDRESFSTYLQPLGLGDIRNIDTIKDANVARLAFENVLQTRDAQHGSRDLLFLTVANDFGFSPGRRDLSGMQVELAAIPARWLQIDFYQRFAPRDFTLNEFNSGITIRDSNVWSVRFSNNFLRTQLNDYAIEGRRRLNESFEAITRLNYDVRKHRFNEQVYGIAQNLGNTWQVSYTVSIYSGRKRESNFGFNVQIDAVRF